MPGTVRGNAIVPASRFGDAWRARIGVDCVAASTGRPMWTGAVQSEIDGNKGAWSLDLQPRC